MPLKDSTYFLRLTALWAFSEALLGGLLHGLRLPVTGLILAGMAAVCLSWLGRLGVKPILKAALLVLLIKALLSPQTPLPAYFAVGLQALAAAFFFWVLPGYRLPTLATCLFALLQSAVQKLIILTLLFGQGFWLAADQWLASLLEKLPLLHHLNVIIVVAGWLMLYALAGLFWAWLALQPPLQVQQKTTEADDAPAPVLQQLQLKATSALRLISGFLAAGLLLYTTEISGWQQLMLRALAIGGLYYCWLIPLLQWCLYKLLQKAQSRLADSLQQVITLIPATRQLFLRCWKASHPAPPFYRPFQMARLLAYEFQPPCKRSSS